jgi:hypothetical protein
VPLLNTYTFIGNFIYIDALFEFVEWDDLGQGSIAIWNYVYTFNICYKGIFYSTLTYLIFRSLFKNKLAPETWLKQAKFPPATETLTAQKDLLALFQNNMVPYYIAQDFAKYSFDDPYGYKDIQIIQLNS